MSFRGFAFHIAVRCGFDKHLYLTSCLNAHNHNTCIRLAQTGCTARKMALFIISQDLQTEVLAAIVMATTINIIIHTEFSWLSERPTLTYTHALTHTHSRTRTHTHARARTHTHTRTYARTHALDNVSENIS